MVLELHGLTFIDAGGVVYHSHIVARWKSNTVERVVLGGYLSITSGGECQQGKTLRSPHDGEKRRVLERPVNLGGRS